MEMVSCWDSMSGNTDYLTQGDYKELNSSLQPCLLSLKWSVFSESHLYSLLSVDQLPLLFHVTAAGSHP